MCLDRKFIDICCVRSLEIGADNNEGEDFEGVCVCVWSALSAYHRHRLCVSLCPTTLSHR